MATKHEVRIAFIAAELEAAKRKDSVEFLKDRIQWAVDAIGWDSLMDLKLGPWVRLVAREMLAVMQEEDLNLETAPLRRGSAWTTEIDESEDGLVQVTADSWQWQEEGAEDLPGSGKQGKTSIIGIGSPSDGGEVQVWVACSCGHAGKVAKNTLTGALGQRWKEMGTILVPKKLEVNCPSCGAVVQAEDLVEEFWGYSRTPRRIEARENAPVIRPYDYRVDDAIEEGKKDNFPGWYLTTFGKDGVKTGVSLLDDSSSRVVYERAEGFKARIEKLVESEVRTQRQQEIFEKALAKVFLASTDAEKRKAQSWADHVRQHFVVKKREWVSAEVEATEKHERLLLEASLGKSGMQPRSKTGVPVAVKTQEYGSAVIVDVLWAHGETAMRIHGTAGKKWLTEQVELRKKELEGQKHARKLQEVRVQARSLAERLDERLKAAKHAAHKAAKAFVVSGDDLPC